ncbi:DUF1552 domain-containing protein [Bdellovibrio sp. HCB337]|uniref:DUF1552 domain-containing protein n=1 Tax=Bdellovibrio sp. HCB337 TaxID=3394358 RepID=UPI0039A5BB91
MSGFKMNRRHFLKGVGVTMALPMLEAMIPCRAFAAGPAQRFVSIYFANGIMWNGAAGSTYNNWECSGTETNFTLSRALMPLNAYKSSLTVVHNLRNLAAEEGMRVDSTTAHWLSTSSFLTGQRYETETHATKLRYAGSSLDQLIGANTPNKFKSLVIGNNYTTEHSGDSRGAAELLNQISWKSQTEQVPRLMTSKAVFDRLFAGGLPNTTTTQPDTAAQKRSQMKLSVVDAVREDAKRLITKLGTADRQKLDQYLTSVNELEKRIQSESTPTTTTTVACSTLPTGGSFQTDTNAFNTKMIPERSRNMMDMMIIAFQCDLTRVVTFMLENEHSELASSSVNYTGLDLSHHTSSHYLDDPAKHVPVKEYFGQWQTNQVAYLINKLQSTADSVNTGSLYDNTLIMAGSGMGDSHAHSFSNLPMILAGRGAGHIGGRLLRYNGQSYSNFLATLAQKFGLPAQMGLSTGTLANLF